MYRPFTLGQPFGANLPAQPPYGAQPSIGQPATTPQPMAMSPFINHFSGASWTAASPQDRQMMFDAVRRNRMGGSNR